MSAEFQATLLGFRGFSANHKEGKGRRAGPAPPWRGGSSARLFPYKPGKGPVSGLLGEATSFVVTVNVDPQGADRRALLDARVPPLARAKFCPTGPRDNFQGVEGGGKFRQTGAKGGGLPFGGGGSVGMDWPISVQNGAL